MQFAQQFYYRTKKIQTKHTSQLKMSNTVNKHPLRTKGEVFLEKIDQQLHKALKFASEPFDEEDITGSITTLGVMIERFLGETVLPNFLNSYTKKSFFCDALKRLHPGLDVNTGVTHNPILQKTEVDALNNLRIQYNKQKHNSGTQISLPDLIQIHNETRAAIVSLINTGLGNLNSKIFESGTTFWIAGTDYVTNGITEVFVHLPLSLNGTSPPPPILTFFVKMDGWSKILTSLARSGSLINGREVLTPNEVDLLMDGDALIPQVYNGPLLPLMEVLNHTRAELVNDKTYNTHNLQHRVAPFTALLLALDILRLGEAAENRDLRMRIQEKLESIGLWTGEIRINVENEIAEIESLMLQLPSSAKFNLTGPVWLDSKSYTRLSSIRNVLSSNKKMAVSPELQIIMDAGST